MTPTKTIADNINQVHDVVATSCARVARNPDSVTLIAVSKTQPVSAILQAIECGISNFGENRVEEAETKIPMVHSVCSEQLKWHMIGHIQSRKTKRIPEFFDTIHSIDRYKVAQKLNEETPSPLSILLEINISGEDSKHGLNAYQWESDDKVRDSLVQEIQPIIHLPRLQVYGLMTMAPYYAIAEETRPIFASLFALRDYLQTVLNVQMPELSMGMTNDYDVAIEEGATMVRVGRAIFGERN